MVEDHGEVEEDGEIDEDIDPGEVEEDIDIGKEEISGGEYIDTVGEKQLEELDGGDGS